VGAISKKLQSRLRKAKGQVGDLRRQAVADFAQVPRDVKGVQALLRSGHDPLHAAYVAVQNFTAFFAESVSQFPEFDSYCRIVGLAQDEYLPAAPPMSPLTLSYFTAWALFDVRFGPDEETIGTCLLDVAGLLEMEHFLVEPIRQFQDSRMGIYEHRRAGERCHLRELVTEEEFTCQVASGFRGKAGELWYVRLCPPILDLGDYHVVFTTPYVLTRATRADWTAYLNKSLLGAGNSDAKKALHEFLKYGNEPNTWNEFIFQSYHHHQTNAIFLAGMPDVKGSRPHGK